MIGRNEILLVWITFFLMMALTTNAGFLVSGDVWELVIAAVFNLCALMVKWKLKTDFMGRVSLALSIAAVLHIVPAALIRECHIWANIRCICCQYSFCHVVDSRGCN